MQEFFKVLLITLVSDIDNMLILGTILRKYTYLKITLPAIIVLTVTRAVYVLIINRLVNVPMLHLVMGIVLLIMAFKLVNRSISGESFTRPAQSSLYLKAKVLFILASIDFLICLDSVIIVAGISQKVEAVTLGIFCSLLISILFLPLIVKLASTFFWINIIAGAFIAQNAVAGILKEPVLREVITRINESFPETDIIYIMSNGTIIIFIIIGVISYIKHQRITIHK